MLRPETASDSRFRNDVRKWLQDELDESLRYISFRPPPDAAREWYRRVAERGWIAPHWEKQWGGMEASPVQQIILMEEFCRAGAPDLPTQGLNHVGPILMRWGNQRQIDLHIPKILTGDVIWCQGYSEPNAGSDLAAVRTRAEISGDILRINGAKIWTTWAQYADWMFGLVRTGCGERRTDGLTFVLLSMSSKGVTVRPIKTISGEWEFCEVFFDDVEVPLDNVIGDVGAGWRVATSLLDEERVRIGSPLQALRALEALRIVFRDHCGNDHLSDLLFDAEMKVEMVTASFLSALESARQDASATRSSSAERSYLKMLATHVTLEIWDLVRRTLGPLALVQGGRADNQFLAYVSESILQARKFPIFGGTNEIQSSIISRHVLGMG